MEGCLRRKLTQGGTFLGGSSLQKPFQSEKLPDVSSSLYSIAEEPFPQVSGFLDYTFGQSFLNTTIELSSPGHPILNSTIEIESSSTEITSQASVVPKSVMSNVETTTSDFVHPVETPSDSSKINLDEFPPKTSKPCFVDSECIQNSETGKFSLDSIFCLDDTLDMNTSFMVKSMPIVFGKEPRFEILRDAKPISIRKRLSVINSVEAHSCEELVGTSHHDGTIATHVTRSSNRSQKVSTHCTSGHSTSYPVNDKKPPTKPIVKTKIPPVSSKLIHPKSGLTPRRKSSINSSAAFRPKTVEVPNVSHQADASSSTLPGNKAGWLNKARHIGNVNYTASAGPVKTRVVSSVPGYTFTAVNGVQELLTSICPNIFLSVQPSKEIYDGLELLEISKHFSSRIPRMKPSGRKPPTLRIIALKTPQTTQNSVETVQPPSRNKPSGLQVLGDFVQPAEAAHESDCINCSKHHEKLDRLLEELVRLRSECKNWGPLHEKLEMCEELKRI